MSSCRSAERGIGTGSSFRAGTSNGARALLPPPCARCGRRRGSPFRSWSHTSRAERYLAVLYRAQGEGELLPESGEGRNFRMPLAEFLRAPGKAPGMEEYMTCFLGEAGELFAEYDDEGTFPLVRQ